MFLVDVAPGDCTRPLIFLARRIRRLGTVTSGVLLAAIGCGRNEFSETGEASETEHICDGSDELTLGMIVGDLAAETSYPQVVETELGYSFLYMDGGCHYWAGTGDLSWGGGCFSAITEGTLSPAEVAALEQDVSYARWTILRGTHAQEDVYPSGVFATNGESTVVCLGECSNESPSADEALRVHGQQWMEKLYRAGNPVSGPMRIGVVCDLTTSSPPAQTVSWPLSSSPSNYVLEGEWDGTLGDSTLIERSGDINALRALRAWYAQSGGRVLRDVIYTQNPEDEVSTCQLVFRDTIPLEDEHGLVPIPSPAQP